MYGNVCEGCVNFDKLESKWDGGAHSHGKNSRGPLPIPENSRAA